MSATASGTRVEDAPTRQTAALGVYAFLASDIMLFSAFFAAYYLLRSQVAEWPPETVELDEPRALVATLVLVASSFTLIVSDRASHRGDRRGAVRWLLVTILLGALFLGNQITEYMVLDFSASDHAYGSIYWLLTLLHSAHVAVGLCALAALIVRWQRGHRGERFITWTTGISAYWHLVDVIWVAVFLSIWVVQ